MKAIFIMLYTVMLLIGWSITTDLRIAHDCVVRENIEVDLNGTPFLNVKFHALFNNDSSVFNMILKCSDKGDRNYDLIKVSPQKLSYSRKRENLDETYDLIVSTIKPGWNGFQLYFIKNVTLTDEENNILLSNESDCTYKSLTLENGNFTESCYSRTPVWTIDSEHGIDISLPKEENHWCQEFNMFSRGPFSPLLQTYSMDYTRNWDFEPLVEYTMTFELQDDKLLIKVENGKTTNENIDIGEDASTLRLHGKDGTKITVVQSTCIGHEQKTRDETMTEAVYSEAMTDNLHSETVPESVCFESLTETVHFVIEGVLLGLLLVSVGVHIYVVIRSLIYRKKGKTTDINLRENPVRNNAVIVSEHIYDSVDMDNFGMVQNPHPAMTRRPPNFAAGASYNGIETGFPLGCFHDSKNGRALDITLRGNTCRSNATVMSEHIYESIDDLGFFKPQQNVIVRSRSSTSFGNTNGTTLATSLSNRNVHDSENSLYNFECPEKINVFANRKCQTLQRKTHKDQANEDGMKSLKARKRLSSF